MNRPKVVSEAEWVVARKELLKKEKEFTHQRDALSAERRKLPWVKIDKEYVFDGPNGKETLADLFDGRSQLIVYHFMSFTKDEEAKGKVAYNYETTEFISDELPGLSVFYKNDEGDVLHSYSCYARGLDILVGTYNFLDLVPKGRDEDPASTMSWVHHHDRY